MNLPGSARRWFFTAACTLTVGCTHVGSPLLGPRSDEYPKINPAPKHDITVQGTVSPQGLRFQMSAIYQARVADDCWKSPLYSGGAFEGTPMPLTVALPIALTWNGNQYSGMLVADRFMPGQCGWHLQAVRAQLSLGSCNGDFTIAQALDPAKKSVETKWFNTSDDPSYVYAQCSARYGWFLRPRRGEKDSQAIVDGTRMVKTHVIVDRAPLE